MSLNVIEIKMENKLITAIKVLFMRDRFLLENDIHERSIAHRLGMYLQPLFSEWDVDCEYNKKEINPKLLDGIKGCNEQKKIKYTLIL